MTAGDDRSTGELGRSIDALTGELRGFRVEFQNQMAALDEKFPLAKVVDMQIYEIRKDIHEMQQEYDGRQDFTANTRRMVYIALLSAVILAPVTALLLIVLGASPH